MDDRIRATAVAAAHNLLVRYKAGHLDWTDDRTPLDDLVSWLGLHIETFHPDDYPPGTYGFLEPGENLIWLCRTLSASLRRFTLAHELGHAILHMPELRREDPCQRPDVQEEVTDQGSQELLQEALGIGQSYDPRSERELAANIFAAELLMPLERVQALYLNEHVLPGSLSSIFDVSNAAMLNRLVGLATTGRPTGRPVPGRPQGSPLPWTETPTPHQVAEGSQPNHGRGDPSWSPPLSPGNATKTIAKKHYDEFQQAAIEAPTPALIVAGPGSGKTSTLIGRTEYLINELQVPPEHILALTFSRKAAQEMLERFESHPGNEASASTYGQPGCKEVLEQVLHQEDQHQTPMVSTFHAFCAEMLRTHGERVGLRPDFALIDDTEGYFLLRQLAGAMQLYHYRNLKSPAYYFPDILKAISRAKDELVSPEQYRQLAQSMLETAFDEEAILSAKKALEVASIYTLYEEALLRRGDTDFGGLIMLAVQLLQDCPEVLEQQQQRFQHILVDEFQDINRASGVLLRLLGGDKRNVWVVGDANQAIYRFRGASPANIANFQQDFPEAVVLPLSRNYRSRPDIVRLAESFRWQQLELSFSTDTEPGVSASEASPRFARPSINQGSTCSPPNRNVQTARLTHHEAYVTLAQAEDNANELAGLIADIRYKHAQGYSYKDMAILCRTRAWAGKITRALAQAGLPVHEKRGILAQQHIKDLLSILLLIADENGMGILRTARQREHPLSQSDIEGLLLAAHDQHRPAGRLIADGAAPHTMSFAGRRSLSQLATILQSLCLYASNVWSLLSQYLFIETSIMRDLLRTTASTYDDLALPENDHSRNSQETAQLADYLAFLQLARRYDQQQETLRRRLEEEATERGEQVEHVLDKSALYSRPSIYRGASEATEQVKGFLDYIHVLLRLGQDGGDSRQQGVTETGAEEPDIIRAMTIHASKGLEFPVVYLPGLIQRNFPLQARANPVPAPAGMLPAESEGKAAHESGEACLFYVGVTRARDQLVLSYSERNGKQKARPTAYLDALLAGLPPERITHLHWQGMIEETYDIDEQEDDLPVIASPSSQPSQNFLDAVKPSTLKATHIEAYQRCPRQYLYSTIYGFRNEEDAYQLFWQATQKTLETLQQQLAASNDPTNNLPTVEEAQRLYTKHWQELGGPALPFAAIYEQHGHEVTALIRDKLLASGDTNWKLRHEFTVEAAGKTIHMTVDRVEAAPAGNQTDTPARFVRARFAKRKEKPSAGTRELLYAQAYRQHHGGQNLELHFHNLSTGEIFPITLTAKKEQSLFNDLEQSIRGLERNEFPAKPDAYLCPTCPFFLICPA